MAREDNSQSPPERILALLLADEVPEMFTHALRRWFFSYFEYSSQF
jgi:hypothetical protein